MNSTIITIYIYFIFVVFYTSSFVLKSNDLRNFHLMVSHILTIISLFLAGMYKGEHFVIALLMIFISLSGAVRLAGSRGPVFRFNLKSLRPYFIFISLYNILLSGFIVFGVNDLFTHSQHASVDIILLVVIWLFGIILFGIINRKTNSTNPSKPEVFIGL